MDYKVIGLICMGVLAAVFGLCRLLIWRWNAYEGGAYDERQVADQNRAGKVSFFTLMVYLSVLQLLRMLALEGIENAMDTLIWVGLLLGIAVYGTIAIWTNGYNVMQKKGKWTILILLALAAVHLADFIDIGYVYRQGQWWFVGTVLRQGGIFGNVDFRVKLVVGLVWLYLAVLVFIRRKLDERE